MPQVKREKDAEGRSSDVSEAATRAGAAGKEKPTTAAKEEGQPEDGVVVGGREAVKREGAGETSKTTAAAGEAEEGAATSGVSDEEKSTCMEETAKQREGDDDDDAYYKLFIESLRNRTAAADGKAAEEAGATAGGAGAGAAASGKGENRQERRSRRRRAKGQQPGMGGDGTDEEAAEEEERVFSDGGGDSESSESSEDEDEEDGDDGVKKKKKGGGGEGGEEDLSYFDLLLKVGTKKQLPTVDHEASEYPEIRKNIYVQVKEITNMKDHEVEALRKTHGNIRVRGKQCPRPIKSFYQCGLPDRILRQDAQRTGTAAAGEKAGTNAGGKDKNASQTAQKKDSKEKVIVYKGDFKEGMIGLVIAPTRELTLQIFKEINRCCRLVQLSAVACYGGAGIGSQLGAIKRGVDVVVGTPGRLIDILTMNAGRLTSLKRVTFIVLDEADRMFDFGFEPQVTSIIASTRPDRQTCMFSATFPPHIEALARRILRKPLEIIVGEKGRTASTVQQYVEDGEQPLLIATSVAARGLDCKHCVLVVNMTCPNHLEDYVHRIGRTGRAGRIGVAYTFLTKEDADKAEELEKASPLRMCRWVSVIPSEFHCL
ncbi:UNVERIFIED_CONTAM: hypothetical protein H355_014953 [Colinus virginianus]|nr:hypothetical protein H355_014953 [Colinus virginianus]